MAVAMAPPRAPYACDPTASRGRLIAEPPAATRSAFRRDCDRVIHATAFRRLKHKTQVFIFDEGDHYRTRLTHTLEVAQIARAVARRLGLDEDLTETLALVHDLGHPPFGHAGERALDRCLAPYGGFDHNGQTLRVVTLLERRYPAFDGLNLTWETLEGIVKHNGPLTTRAGHAISAHGVPWAVADYVTRHDLALWSHASLEAQVAALADDIAYDAHDIDDGLRAGLFDFDALSTLPVIGDIIARIRGVMAQSDPTRQAAELIRDLIAALIDDVVTETTHRLRQRDPHSVDEVRSHDAPLAAFSPAMAAAEFAIKAFLMQRMYRAPRVMRIMGEAEAVVEALFVRYLGDPQAVPSPDWARDLSTDDADAHRARRVGDFIAGMTDRYALDEHARLFDLHPDLR